MSLCFAKVLSNNDPRKRWWSKQHFMYFENTNGTTGIELKLSACLQTRTSRRTSRILSSFQNPIFSPSSALLPLVKDALTKPVVHPCGLPLCRIVVRTILTGDVNHRLSFATEERIAFTNAPLRPVPLQPDATETDLLPLAKLLPLSVVLEHAPSGWTEELAVAVAVADVALLQAVPQALRLLPLLLPSLLSSLHLLSEQLVFFNLLSYGFYRKMTSRKLEWRTLSRFSVN